MAGARKLNCWEFAECGRGPGYPDSGDVCRAARESALDGINGGINGGRACWAVVGSYAVDVFDCCASHRCSVCEFRRLVAREELPDLAEVPRILEKLGYVDVLSLVCRPELEVVGTSQGREAFGG